VTISAPWPAALRESAAALGVHLGDDAIARLAEFMRLLLEHNARFNLTAITDPRQIAVKHFLDSLTCLTVMPEGLQTLCDAGSGAGFPGIPVAIARPDLRVALIESTKKKCQFLETCTSHLALTNVRIICARAEDAGRDPRLRESFQMAVSRAVASLPVLAELCLPLVTQTGIFVAMKGPEGRKQAEAAASAIGALGGALESIHVLTLPGGAGQRSLVVVRKVAATPDRYPRRPGIPAKRPLR
jgi:16S rRNA (guanine527-N7)-methyltransferase